MKRCPKCNSEKHFSEFYSSKTRYDQLSSYCKDCCKIYSAKYQTQNKSRLKLSSQEYYKDHKEIICKKVSQYQRNNKEKRKKYLNSSIVKIKRKIMYQKNKNNILEKNKKWRLANRKYLSDYRRVHKQTNLLARLASNLRSRLYYSVMGYCKKGSAIDDLGCSVGQLKLYLENYFSLYPGMNWDNYGSEWELDHYLPLSSFDLMDENQVKEACHYTNIQPLWKEENRRKSNKVS